METIELGMWEDQFAGTRAEVVKVDETHVWYRIPAFVYLCPITRDLWLRDMIKVK